MTEISASGPILPSLQPPHWPDADAVLCEPLVGDAHLWNDAIALPWVAYGIDGPDMFEYFAAAPERLIELRAAARSTLTGLSFALDRLDFDDFSVVDVHGSYFASESILDPERMRDFQARFGCDMLAVGVPCRGHAYVTSGGQAESALRRFVALVERQYMAAAQPLFALPVLVQDGDLVGLLRLAADAEFEED